MVADGGGIAAEDDDGGYHFGGVASTGDRWFGMIIIMIGAYAVVSAIEYDVSLPNLKDLVGAVVPMTDGELAVARSVGAMLIAGDAVEAVRY